MKTLSQLKEEGYEVRVTHLRMAPGLGHDTASGLLVQPHIARKLGLPIDPRGGITITEVREKPRTNPDGTTFPSPTAWARGFAFVHPKDNFNKKVGVAIALGRALANI